MFSWGEALLFAMPAEQAAVVVSEDPASGLVEESVGAPATGGPIPRSGSVVRVGSSMQLERPSTVYLERTRALTSGEATGGEHDPSFLYMGGSREVLSTSSESLLPNEFGDQGDGQARVRRGRYMTTAMRARAGDDTVLIRRTNSFAYNQRRKTRLLNLAGGYVGGVATDGFDDEPIAPTLSYAEIQQAASRCGLEVTPPPCQFNMII
ncbi:hypothetical protein T492DRAFT_71949 [Pavlovales sp. CCMP2436]|nr:hypothetical protein T492DRAFT_71949 [Pavlovales sp. CCMP2436]